MVRRYVRQRRRRGAVAVFVAVLIPLLVGMAALAIDVGMLYNARAELQRSADAAALAAASDLGDYSHGDPLVNARNRAAQFTQLNQVMGSGVELEETDVVFGSAAMDLDTGRYTFYETEVFPNAVRVRVRRTENSPSGPIPTIMARIFGNNSANVAAQATAVLVPRDITFVIDLSTSHNDDSSLRNFKIMNIGNTEFWRSLWDPRMEEQSTDPETGQYQGPFLGNMSAWGTAETGPGWDFTSDPGLVRLARGQYSSLSNDFVSQTLSANGYGNYTSAEMSAINSNQYDNDISYYRRRVLVGLGIYRWKSGISGGQSGGNGNSYIGAGEVEEMVPYPGSDMNPETGHKHVGGSWDDFVDYCINSNSSMCRYDPTNQYYGDAGLRYRFGMKTWVDYLQERAYGQNVSPGLANTLQQPWGAVADAVQHCLTVVEDLDSDDRVGLAGYATYGYGPSNRPNDMSWLTDDINHIRGLMDNLQPGMWTTNTNIAAGIDHGVNVLLNSLQARPNASKVMLLLTDGIANTIRNGSSWNVTQAKQDTKDAANDAAMQGIRIYTISVGANADVELMEEVAEIGHGEHFHAAGYIDEYASQLEDIFKKLGGKRPIILIE